MKIKELIEKLETMPPEKNVAFINGMIIYGAISCGESPSSTKKESEAKHGRKTH